MSRFIKEQEGSELLIRLGINTSLSQIPLLGSSFVWKTQNGETYFDDKLNDLNTKVTSNRIKNLEAEKNSLI